MDAVIKAALAAGMTDARVIKTTDIYFDEALRAACESNVCGSYGKSWSCSPQTKPVAELKKEILAFGEGVVVQFVGQLEDSFDVESMYKHNADFRERFKNLVNTLRPQYRRLIGFGAGTCPVCPECTYPRGLPCAQPDRKMVSVEAAGIFVAKTLEACGLKYNNGPNTVTYAGLILSEN